ncbi:hypothetical protein B0H63DRAFT_523480 [Podospora didyma]|uniref:DUF6604 domain-containing protein n=1 Tax=Podospora didyma TaxID=330526 RepID=A0AAE0NRH6_9PEZI|nr:hypothetical protein B0H63DRAFT_523480 [Podospora didyma]
MEAEAAAAETVPESTSEAKPAPYILAIHDFVPLAKFLVQNREWPVTVPSTVLTVLDGLIKARAGVSAQLREHDAKTDSKSDKSHSHFVVVLKCVQNILKPCMVTTDAKASADKAVGRNLATDESSEVKFASRFDGFSVDEPSEQFLSTPPAKTPANTADGKGVEVVYEAEPANSGEDILFATAMLMNDLNNLRSHVRDIWKRVERGHGECDAATAAIVTDHDIGLGDRLIQELAPLHENFENCIIGAVRQIYKTSCLNAEFTKDQLSETSEAADFNLGTYDIADENFIAVTCFVTRIAEIVRKTVRPSFVGLPPTARDEYPRKFDLQFGGVDIAVYARGNRGRNGDVSKRSVRCKKIKGDGPKVSMDVYTGYQQSSKFVILYCEEDTENLASRIGLWEVKIDE